MDARIGKLIQGLCFGALIIAALTVSIGCASTSKARAKADAESRAAQQQALRLEEARKRSISFTGPVVNPLVPWTEGLTLGQAMGAAGWRSKNDPRLIILTRGQEIVTMTPEHALQAAGEPVQPGDHVDMLP